MRPRRPGRGLRIARLADYGAISFDAISITDSRGAKGGIVSPHWNATKIIQLRDSGGATLAAAHADARRARSTSTGCARTDAQPTRLSCADTCDCSGCPTAAMS